MAVSKWRCRRCGSYTYTTPDNSGESGSCKLEAPWMDGFGALSDLSDENRRVLHVIEQEFETLAPEDLA